MKKNPDLSAISSDQFARQRYVKWFCNYYKRDEGQRGMAEAILKSCRKQANDYLSARRKNIEKAQRLSQIADDETRHKYHAAKK